MKSRLLVLFFFLLVINQSFSQSKESLKFKSLDGVDVHADLYMPYVDSATMVILLHQAGWSRGEYGEIAMKLNEMGFNCLAVDLRSGNQVNGVVNLTNQSARLLMKETLYIHSLPDIIASVNHAREFLASDKLILWGSSYSSSLAIVVAAEMPDRVDAVMSFSPGEYFKSMDKPDDYIASHTSKLNMPVFLTGSKSEKEGTQAFYDLIPGDNKVIFIPETSGNHGSRALWSSFSDSRAYWRAVKSFLEPFLD
jgi:pimeloyl-ACP methyl ester carboxylesterase